MQRLSTYRPRTGLARDPPTFAKDRARAAITPEAVRSQTLTRWAKRVLGKHGKHLNDDAAKPGLTGTALNSVDKTVVPVVRLARVGVTGFKATENIGVGKC